MGFAHSLLFTHHILSIGWSDFSSDAFVKEVQTGGEAAFEGALQAEGWGLPKNRWNLWRFIMEMKKGDIVLVPTSQEFSLFEIEDDVIFSNESIDSSVFMDWNDKKAILQENGYYYIMHAEGGTGPDHSVMICRSREIWGPYEGNPKNPILTHRHLGNDYPVKYVGHGDLIKTPNNEWFMTMLAVRPLNRYTTMGRETFLAKFIWEDEWPVVNPGVGMLTEKVEIDPEIQADFLTRYSQVVRSYRNEGIGRRIPHAQELS